MREDDAVEETQHVGRYIISLKETQATLISCQKRLQSLAAEMGIFEERQHH